MAIDKRDALICAAATVACLTLLELAFRAVSGVPILSLADWSKAGLRIDQNAVCTTSGSAIASTSRPPQGRDHQPAASSAASGRGE